MSPGDGTPQTTLLLRASGVTQVYGGNVALSDVDFDLRAGEVHALFGENGAGKSTLIKVLTGNLRPDRGSIAINGETYPIFGPREARAAGVSAVFQEFTLAPTLSVLDNLFLGRELTRFGALSRSRMRTLAQSALEEIGFQIDVDEKVVKLSRAQRQMSEICKALLLRSSILILDEPTASLNDHEADALLEVVRRLRARGVGVIYVSHRLREIYEIADRITVLRSGRHITTRHRESVGEDELIELMTGRRLEALFPKFEHRPGRVCVRMEHVAAMDNSVRDASLTLHAGEIVGMAGLAGSGKSEVGEALFGLRPLRAGRIEIDGEPTTPSGPAAMLARRLCYFPPDRARLGLAMSCPIVENGSMTALTLRAFSRFGFLRRWNERRHVASAMRTLNVRPLDLDLPVANLSGGNMQKVLLARGLVRETRIFVFDEPTVGIDVSAKAEIYGILKRLVEEGAAMLLISSDLQEVLSLSHRIYVMNEGRTVVQLQGAEKTEDNVLKGFFGRLAELSQEVRVA